MVRRLIPVGLVVVAWGCADGPGTDAPLPRLGASNSISYIDDAACADCHAVQYDRWTECHHDLGMQVAGEASVLGDFGGSAFTHFDVTSRFFTNEGRFVVTTEVPTA